LVAVTVTDSQDGATFTDSAIVSVENQAPSPSITGAPATPANENSPLTLTATAGEPLAPGETFSYEWEVTKKTKNGVVVPLTDDISKFKDQTSIADFQFTPDDEGTYVFTLTVTDEDGAAAPTPATATVNVQNVAPQNVDAGGVQQGDQQHVYTISEGDSLTLTASAADAAPDRLTFVWDLNNDRTFGDVTDSPPVSSKTSTKTLTWSDLAAWGIKDGPATHTIRVKVLDDVGAESAEGQATLTVNNTPPQNVELGLDLTRDEATPVTLSAGDVSDPGNLDTLTHTWTVTKDNAAWGNWTTTTPNLSFTPDDNGAFVVKVEVGDGGSEPSVDQMTLTVQNTPPTNVSAGGPYTINEGSGVTLTASATDAAGTLDPLTYTWDVNGDGTFSDQTYGTADGASATFTWAQLNDLGINDGPMTSHVRVKALDGDTGETISPYTRLTVANVAPTPTLTVDTAELDRLESRAIQIKISDPPQDPGTQDGSRTFDPAGPNDPLTYGWDLNYDGITFIPNDSVAAPEVWTDPMALNTS